MADQSVQATGVVVGYAPAGAGCEAAGGYAPTLMPGEEFSVCVTVTVRIPLLPEFVDANTATGQFLVERDRNVDASSHLPGVPRGLEAYQVASTRQGPPEPSAHGTSPTVIVAPHGGS